MPVHPKRRRNAKHELMHFLRKRTRGGMPYLYLRSHGIQNAMGGPGTVTWTRAGTKTTVRDGRVWDLASGAPDTGGWIEQAATNLCLQNENMNTSPWAPGNCTATEDNAVAPNGLTTATTLTATGAGDVLHHDLQSISVTSGTEYAISCWVKNVDTDWVAIQMGQYANAYQFVNINTGVPGTRGANANDGGVWEVADNGWYRIWVAVTADATATREIRISMATADNDFSFEQSGETLHVWRPQFEASPYPTSGIVTTTLAVARIADQPVINNVTPVTDKGLTIALRWYQPANTADLAGSFNTFFDYINGLSGEDSIRLIANNSNATFVQLRDGGVIVGSDTSVSSTSAAGWHTCIISCVSGNSVFWYDGKKFTNTGSFTFGDEVDQDDIYLGADSGAGGSLQAASKITGLLFLPNYAISQQEQPELLDLINEVMI